ncbi:MAG: hypothetical protein ACREX4_12510 [Gammaproteobacteria bacterium]
MQRISALELISLTAVIGAPVFLLSAAAVVVYLRKTHSSWRYALGASVLWLMVAVCGSVAAWFALGAVFPRLPESAFMILGFINLPALLSSLACLLAGYGLNRLFRPNNLPHRTALTGRR